MLSDDNRLPKSLAGLFGTAASLYARRFSLYAALAVIALAVQYVVGVLLPHTTGTVLGLAIIVDAFFYATVSIGVAFDLAGKDADWSTVLLAASERWGVVTIVGFLYWLVSDALYSSVFGSPEDTLYGVLALPVIVFWAAVSLGQVVAAIEPVKTQLSLPFLAIGKGMAVAFRAANLSRLVVLAIVIVLPNVATIGLAEWLGHRHWHDYVFWANVPIDAITVGPLQALSTVFYIDFLRRAR